MQVREGPEPALNDRRLPGPKVTQLNLDPRFTAK